MLELNIECRWAALDDEFVGCEAWADAQRGGDEVGSVLEVDGSRLWRGKELRKLSFRVQRKRDLRDRLEADVAAGIESAQRRNCNAGDCGQVHLAPAQGEPPLPRPSSRG